MRATQMTDAAPFVDVLQSNVNLEGSPHRTDRAA